MYPPCTQTLHDSYTGCIVCGRNTPHFRWDTTVQQLFNCIVYPLICIHYNIIMLPLYPLHNHAIIILPILYSFPPPHILRTGEVVCSGEVTMCIKCYVTLEKIRWYHQPIVGASNWQHKEEKLLKKLRELRKESLIVRIFKKVDWICLGKIGVNKLIV